MFLGRPHSNYRKLLTRSHASVCKKPVCDTYTRFCPFGVHPPIEESLEDLFRVLELPRRFRIDETELQQSYRRLMAEYHPDKHVNKSESERKDLDNMASLVTDAFAVLRRPHSRATHLLELAGNPMDETSKTDLVGCAFLMEVMELREAIEQAEPDSEELKGHAQQTAQQIKELVEGLDDAFQQEDYTKALQMSAKLQYWHRIQETIHEKLELE